MTKAVASSSSSRNTQAFSAPPPSSKRARTSGKHNPIPLSARSRVFASRDCVQSIVIPLDLKSLQMLRCASRSICTLINTDVVIKAQLKARTAPFSLDDLFKHAGLLNLPHQDWQGVLSHCKRFEEFVGHSTRHRLDDQLFNAIVPHLPTSLRKLNLASCEAIANPNLDALFKRCPELESFVLCSALLEEPKLKMINDRCKQLASIDLSYTILSEGEVVDVASNCPRMRRLVTPNSVGDQGLIFILGMCVDLDAVNLYLNTGISDAALTALAAHKKPLQSLTLSSQWVTDDGLKHLAKHQTQLRSLALPFCTEITDSGMPSLMNCQKLEMIDISDCPKITLKGIQILIASCKNLKVIKLATENSAYLKSVVTGENLEQLRKQYPHIQFVIGNFL